jgi:hypothetical protein
MSQNGYALMTEPDDLSAQELGALLAGKARRVDKPCLECRTTMRSVTVRREFCSPKCRQKHWRHRLFGLRPGEPMVYVNHRREPSHTDEPGGPGGPSTPTSEDPSG